MGFIQRFFQRRANQARVAAIERQIRSDYPDQWLQGFHWLGFPTANDLKDYVIKSVATSRPQRVLVVGRTEPFASLGSQELVDYDVFLNTNCDLGWLCEFCNHIRQSPASSFLVSNFPRQYEPPKVRFKVGSNYVVKLGSRAGGTLYETVTPPGASVALCGENDKTTTLSIFFAGVCALSYYDAVLRSQQRTPGQLVHCSVLATPTDNGLLIEQQNRLKGQLDADQQKSILTEASHNLELFARFYPDDLTYTEAAQYSGGILSNFTLPDKIPSRQATRPAAHAAAPSGPRERWFFCVKCSEWCSSSWPLMNVAQRKRWQAHMCPRCEGQLVDEETAGKIHQR